MHLTLRFTDHARRRCAEMGLTTKQIKHAMREPAATYPGHSGRLVSICGDFAVVYRGNEVITVLWHGLETREAGLSDQQPDTGDVGLCQA